MSFGGSRWGREVVQLRLGIVNEWAVVVVVKSVKKSMSRHGKTKKEKRVEKKKKM